jgi:CheY-like chemotaxis protein
VSCTILIVEDNQDSRELLADYLSATGYQIEVAENGKVGLDKLKAGLRPTLVLLDLTMPVMDGWQMHAEMKADPELASVPVIIVSAVDSLSLPKGVQGMLPKPIEIDLLSAIVRHYCGPP